MCYDQTFFNRLSFVLRSRELGFSINEIRSLLELVDKHESFSADLRELTLWQEANAWRKTAVLRKPGRLLKDIAAQCHGNRIPDCPIVDVLLDGK